MIFAIENKDELKDLEELDELQWEVEQVRFDKKLGKQGFHYDAKELIEPINRFKSNIV